MENAASNCAERGRRELEEGLEAEILLVDVGGFLRASGVRALRAATASGSHLRSALNPFGGLRKSFTICKSANQDPER